MPTLRTIGIIVNDMEQTLAFYRTLGLPISPDIELEDNIDVQLPNGVTLGFLTAAMARQADPSFQTPIGHNMNLQVECDSPVDVDTTYEHLIEAGYTSYAQPWDAFWGQRFARVSDPDGRVVNLYAQL